MENIKRLIQKLPDAPGVYIFRGAKRSFLYIGKATSIRARVASYFNSNLIEARGPIIASMIEAVKTVDFIKTDSVLEALILEAHAIKKYKPPYNTKEKDNKSFNYVVITKEDFPRILIMRSRNLETKHPSEIKYSFGPFPQGSVLSEALKIVRKIFPFRDKCKPCGQPTTYNQQLTTKHKCKPCFNAQIGLCPGVCAGKISQKEYAKTIQHIKLFFEGKKPALLRSLEQEMNHSAKELNFEKASYFKKTIFALKHIQDVALLKVPRSNLGTFRIEAYDIAHISGAHTVGVMTVIEDGEVKKSDYRKFKIKTSTNDDNSSLREMLSRRFEHTEWPASHCLSHNGSSQAMAGWPIPKLIVVDGGKAQVGTAEKALKECGIVIPVVGVVKDEHHKPKGILYGKNINPKLRAGISIFEHAILLANSEAHRFAIGYHRKLRGKNMLIWLKDIN